MTICLYTTSISPHQLPLARALVSRVGAENFRYVFTSEKGLSAERLKLGWRLEGEKWIIPASGDEARYWLETCDVLLCSLRSLDLFERRHQAGKLSFYTNERWFKPPLGRLRLLVPSYFRMARRFRKLVKAGAIKCLPIGVHAAADLAAVVERPWRCDHALGCSRVPMGAIEHYPWMRLWGYFVEPTSEKSRQEKGTSGDGPLRVLWVGRLLNWKRVDVLIKAVSSCADRLKISLTIIGDGPQKPALERLANRLLAQGLSNVTFLPPCSIAQIRAQMRAHDVYVLPSNAYEGWGAVVSEALEESLPVLGSREAGASATLLPEEQQFESGNWRQLAQIIAAFARCGCHTEVSGIGAWSAASAADRFLDFVKECGVA